MIPMKLHTPYEMELVKTHLVSLPDTDRHLRFGSYMSDEVIEQYVENSWGGNNEWMGIIENDEIIAAIHVAPAGEDKSELGLSVDPKWRGRKLGQALFERAVVFLKANSVKEVYMHCLAENKVMKHIASKNHMKLFTSYGETDADLVLPEPTLIDPYQEAIVEQLAIYDNNIRTFRNAWRHIWTHKNETV